MMRINCRTTLSTEYIRLGSEMESGRYMRKSKIKKKWEKKANLLLLIAA